MEYTQIAAIPAGAGQQRPHQDQVLTFSIEADSIRSAKPRLERIETDVLNNFKRLGVARRGPGRQSPAGPASRHLHMDEQAPFQFEWDWLGSQRTFTKDFIAPSGFEFRTGKQFRMGKKYGVRQLRADSGPGTE